MGPPGRTRNGGRPDHQEDDEKTVCARVMIAPLIMDAERGPFLETYDDVRARTSLPWVDPSILRPDAGAELQHDPGRHSHIC